MNKQRNIAIIGGGYVGLHTALRLSIKFPNNFITIFDVDTKKIDKWKNNQSPIDDYFMEKFIEENNNLLSNIVYKQPDDNWENYDIFFLALSTNPVSNDVFLNTKPLFNLVGEIRAINPRASIFIRSTINISDSEILQDNYIGYWPEFLSQGIDTSENLGRDSNVIYIPTNDYYADDFFNCLFNGTQIIKAPPQEVIMVKVMHNSIDAHLITLTNLFANISEENDIDFSIISPVVELLLKSRSKIKKPGIGYGGSCYPKDSYSLLSVTENNQNKKLIQSLEDFNNEQSYAFLFKEDIIRNASNIIVLGVSFKGGTNDITRTPTLALRNWLLSNNIKYKIWEPMINENLIIFGETISNQIEKDIVNSDLVIVASDWTEFNFLLKDYDSDIIDLKSYINFNGKMKLHYIGGK